MSVFVWIQGGFLLLCSLQKSYHTTGSKEGICDEAPWADSKLGVSKKKSPSEDSPVWIATEPRV